MESIRAWFWSELSLLNKPFQVIEKARSLFENIENTGLIVKMKMVTIVGARPQFVKAASVSRVIAEYNRDRSDSIQEIIVHTGQHYDANMSDVFFDEMNIPKPGYALGIGGGRHGAMTGRQLEKIEEVLIKESPDWVLVYGDTNSTIAGALAAAKLHIPVAHVEAGLRSFNLKMPEEVNRVLTDNLSKVLFCPTVTAVSNLVKEGFEHRPCDISLVGDVMFDAVKYYKKDAIKPDGLQSVKDFVLATVHRAENTDSEERIVSIVRSLNALNKRIDVVCPMHPRTRNKIGGLGIDVEFSVIEPVTYFQMLWLLENCTFVITDSGGLQKEAYFFSKRCVTLRDETEWVELVDSGCVMLVGTDEEKIISVTNSLLDQKDAWQNPSGSLYGDGKAAEKILDKLLSDLTVSNS